MPSFVADVYREAREHELSGMAAGLAFFGLFAFPPLLMSLLLAGGAIVGDAAAEGRLLEAVEATLGAEVREPMAQILHAMPRFDEGNHLSHLVALGVLVFSTLAGFRHLQRSFDLIWDVRNRGLRESLLRFLRQITSFVVVILVAVLFLVAASAGLLVTSFPEQLGGLFSGNGRSVVAYGLDVLSIFLIAFILLTLLYKIVPATRVPWRSAALGALFASLALGVGRHPVALYMKYTWRGSAFGAASFVVAILIAFYAAAFVILIGVVVGRVAALRRTARASPGAESPG